MSRYGSVTITGASSLISRVVQAAEAYILQSLVNDAITALPQGYVVVDITLAGGGDGHTFTVTIEAGATADVTGGFESPPSVSCFLASEAQALLLQNQATAPTSGTVADVQVAGGAKGTRFMGMFVSGVIAGGDGGSCPPINAVIYVGVTTPATTTPTGAQCAPYPTLAEGVAAAAALDPNVVVSVSIIVANGDYTPEGVLALPVDGKFYYIHGLDGFFRANFSIDAAALVGSTSYSFHNLTSGNLPIIGGVGGSVIHLSFSADRGDDGGQDGAPLLEHPGIDDSGFAGSAIKVTLQGGHCVQDWNAGVATDVNAWGTLLGYVPGDLNFRMSVHAFEQMDSCHIIGAELTAAAAPIATPTSRGGLCGWTAGMFSGGCTFAGPAGSFVLDDLSASTFISSGGTLPGAGTTVLTEGLMYGLYSVRPSPALLPGRPFKASDGTVEFVTDGVEWRPIIDGVVGKQVPLVAAWTDTYGTQGTATDVTGTTYVTTNSGAGVQAYGKSIAHTAPTRIVCNVDVIGETDGNIGALQGGASGGLYVSNGNDAILWTLLLTDDGSIAAPGIGVLQYTAPGAGGIFAPGAIPQISNLSPSPVHWLALDDDGANIVVQYSLNGRTWVTFGTYSYAAIGFTPNRIGIISANRSSTGLPSLASFRSVEIEL